MFSPAVRGKVHAYAGAYHALNTITDQLRMREAGKTTWLQTLGPCTRSIDTKSSLLNTSFKWRHNVVSRVFENLPPGVEVAITTSLLKATTLAAMRRINDNDGNFF